MIYTQNENSGGERVGTLLAHGFLDRQWEFKNLKILERYDRRELNYKHAREQIAGRCSAARVTDRRRSNFQKIGKKGKYPYRSKLEH